MSLPGPLADLDLGEPALGHLRTAAQIPFLTEAGEEKLASLWFVICRTRCWLVAATSEHQWSVGDCDVALEKGWTWDAIRVGAWTAPLRSRTRSRAEALLRQWRLCERSGSSVPAPVVELSDERARIAAGSSGVPDWVAERVPCDPDARWLLAVQTDRELGFLTQAGKLVREPLWFAISDRSIVLTAAGPEAPFVREIEGPVELRPHTTARDELIAGGWSVPGALIDRKLPAAVELANAAPADRWAVAMALAIDASEPDRAIDLAREAFVLQRHGTAWGEIGLLLVDEAVEAATGAVLHQLAADPPLDLQQAALGWARQRPKLRSRSAQVPAGILAECAVPQLPEGLPWPPTGPTEVYAIGAILAGRVADGLALWAHKADTPRVHQAIAATAEPAECSEAWVQAAEHWRPHDPTAARECLERAIARSEDPTALHWRAGAWASIDGEDPTAHWESALHTAPPADLDQPIRAWRALARLAEERGAWETAVAAWHQISELDPSARRALVHEAHLLETRLGRVDEAIASLRILAERTEAVVEPEPTRWWVWAELGRLLALGEDADSALSDALSEALRGDFLVPEAYTAVLEIGEGRLDAVELDWWRHIQAQLTGRPGPSPRPPMQSLSAETLDALHPSGIGWLEKIRQGVDTSEPPPLSDLTRGLERVDPERWPRLAADIANLSGALGIEPPATYLFRGEGAWGMSSWPTEPPLVLLGHDHLLESHALGMRHGALVFGLAVELVHLAARHPLLAFDGGVVGTSRSVYMAFGKYAGAAETVVDVVTLLPGVDQINKIQTVIKLSRRVFTARAMVDKTTGFAETGMNLLGWDAEDESNVGRRFEGPALQFRLQADRAALLLTGDLESAIEAILLGQPDTAPFYERAAREGLLAVLGELDADTTMRLASLLEFAATL